MPTVVRSASKSEDPWVDRIKSMITDGRLTFDKEVNGKKLYTLDRKKLNMPE
jgi:hypothetical protein